MSLESYRVNNRILVLEDDDVLRQTLQEALELEGYKVSASASSQHALETARMHRFDLIIADVRMEGMDGIECLGCLRALQPRARSIVITGYASTDAPTRAMKVQAEDYLHKPFSLDDFLNAVESVLASEERRGSYAQLFDKFKSEARKVWQAITRVAARGAQNAMETQRDEAFRAFFVGVRSRLMNLEQAHGAWEKLHARELERENLVQQECPAPSAYQEVAVGYKEVADYVQAVSSSQMAPLLKNARVAASDFTALFHNIHNSLVFPEQLKLAAFLYARSAALREHSPALEEFYNAIWREPE